MVRVPAAARWRARPDGRAPSAGGARLAFRRAIRGDGGRGAGPLVDFGATRSLRLRTAWRMFPYAVRHMVAHPFRSSPEAERATAGLRSPEIRRTAHDMYCDMFLRGYQQATSLPVAPATGLALVLFVVFISTFDQESERARRRGGLPDYEVVIAEPAVAEIWNALRDYLRAFGREEAVMAHVAATFAAHYDDYRAHVLDSAGRTDFGVTLNLVKRDSGLTVQTFSEVVRLFNSHPLHAGCAQQFFAVGMAGKFLDDMRDMVDDVAAGEPNLLFALAAGNERDLGVLQKALNAGTAPTPWWWARHCPDTFASYLGQARYWYEQVTTPRLRLPLDVLMTLVASPRYWRRPIRRSPVGGL